MNEERSSAFNGRLTIYRDLADKLDSLGNLTEGMDTIGECLETMAKCVDSSLGDDGKDFTNVLRIVSNHYVSIQKKLDGHFGRLRDAINDYINGTTSNLEKVLEEFRRLDASIEAFIQALQKVS